ncbi:N-acetyltransferase [Periweissella cryptocerci]|uniref:N-acetyltransferase n=1 Tax=Periweissella cryptocerci TaxID=2506420 RepID=A0A4P6YWL1_9LACO|nr:GNAT family N-acetyltransferase [Periweissella cryptocerci]QBO37214.1 N-acetyltransferase [Periweissella cryptocerci]
MIIRKATKKDLAVVTDLTYAAFKDYPLFAVSDNKAKLKKALHFLLRLNTAVNIKSQDSFVCVENDEIVASFILKAPKHQHTSLMAYLLSGGWRIFFNGSRTISKQLLHNLDKANKILDGAITEYWYLDTLVVSPKFQGQKIGSRTLTKIKKVVKEAGGHTLCLITNTELNAMFYEKNGFEEIRKQSFSTNNQVHHTWLFMIKLI